jgi:hypothetical protein
MVHLPLVFYQRGWILFGLFFAVLETLALLDPQRGDTLSENIRWVRDQHPVLLAFLIGTTITWLFIHFLYEDNAVPR